MDMLSLFKRRKRHSSVQSVPSPQPTPQPPRVGSGQRILCLFEEHYFPALTGHLENSGFVVDRARTLVEAKAHMQTAKPDVILTQLVLKFDGEGTQWIKEGLKNRWPEVTAWQSIPFNPSELAQTIAKTLALPPPIT